MDVLDANLDSHSHKEQCVRDISHLTTIPENDA